MPAKSTALPLFIQRRVMDLVMFGAVTFHRSALPGVSVERVMELFKKFWGDTTVNASTLKATYFAMQREFIDLQRSAPEQKQFRVQVEVLGRDLSLSIHARTPEEASDIVKDQFTYHDLKVNRVEEEHSLTPAA